METSKQKFETDCQIIKLFSSCISQQHENNWDRFDWNLCKLRAKKV